MGSLCGSLSTSSYTQLSSEDEFWGKVPLFQCLPVAFHPQLTACSQPVEFEPGAIIFKQNDVGDEFYVIQEGRADVIIDGIVQATVGIGDYFGEVSLLSSEPRTATVKATHRIRALMICRKDFQNLGLHEKLSFPKRNKVNLRHQMMAVGTAGVNINKGPSSQLAGLERTQMQSQSIIKRSAEFQKSYYRKNLEAVTAILSERLNIFAFVFVPLGQYVDYAEMGPGIVFGVNFLAIIPLASILGAATESLASHTGQLIGGLLNATFGNAVEMIMCVQAVKAGLVKVVQGNLLGSILSNLLLVLGMAIFASGTARKTQKFNQQGAASNMTCQLVASISVCLPTCFAAVAHSREGAVLMISRICAVLLMLVYGMFLFFMLRTHADLFADEEEEAEQDEDGLSPALSVTLLFATTLVVFLCSECLIDSIDGVTEKFGLSKAFIGVILLPIVGNAAEHATAVTCAYKGMMDLALGVAVGSSTQIALFVVPCAIMFGWYYGEPMNLDFSTFDTTCQMLTVFLVSQVLSHGETNWLHGTMLMTVYVLVATQNLFITEQELNAGRG